MDLTPPADKESFEVLWEILAASKKSDLKVLCRKAVVTKPALSNLILGSMSGVTPWHHRRHHRHFVPDHLIITETDKVALATNGVGPMKPAAQKFANKISAIFDERRLLSGHLFFSDDLSNWHLLYFDQRDMSRHGNHWDGGAHIHIINHLWPQRTAQGIWEEFCSEHPKMKGALHIRFEDRMAQHA